MTEPLFCSNYHEDREAFTRELESFARRTGRELKLHRYSVDAARDLTITAAEFSAPRPERVYVATCGIHGVEGFAGSAILRALLRDSLARLPADDTGLLLVHALNPFGFERGIRVNRNNVDLNRNCAPPGDPLFGSYSPEYAALRGVLAPARPYRPSLKERLRFYAGIGQALARSGTYALRQAVLGGQYIDPSGVFYGGARVEPEIAFFQEIFTPLATSYREVLLTDLHTGYGVRGHAYPLFGRADSREFRAYTQSGVQDGGTDKAYTVHGDLVGYCYHTSKRARPDSIFNGVVVELGTHGLSMRDQLSDLQLVVAENQARQHGAAERASTDAVSAAFREQFNPSDPAWRRAVQAVGVDTVKRLLQLRGYL
jgi:hypothetical protein